MKIERLEGEDGGWSLYHHEDDGREVLVDDFDSSGSLRMAIRRNDTAGGELAVWTVHDGRGQLIKRFVITFADDGGPDECLQYDADGTLEERGPAD